MKTVCPHCNEEYEVPDNYLQQEAECSMCCKTFTITQTKYCSKCGTPNPMQAFFCESCQAPFNPITPIPEKKEISEPKKRSSSADSLGTFTYICFWIHGIYYFLGVVIFGALGLVDFVKVLFSSPFGFWTLPVFLLGIILYTIFLVPFYVIASMSIMVTESHRKIYWTRLRKISIWLILVFAIVGTLCFSIYFFSFSIPSLYSSSLSRTSAVFIFLIFSFVLIAISFFLTIMPFKLMKLFNIRAEEDVDFVEDKAFIAKHNRKRTIINFCLITGSGVCLFSLCLIPFIMSNGIHDESTHSIAATENAESQYSEGEKFSESKEYEKAFLRFKETAEKGDAKAQFIL